MRGLGFASNIIVIIGAILIFMYPGLLGWGGMIGAIVGVLAGVGFASLYPYGKC